MNICPKGGKCSSVTNLEEKTARFTPLHILNALWSMPNWASPEHLKVGIFE